MYDAWLAAPLSLSPVTAAQVADLRPPRSRTRQQRAVDVYTPLDPAQVLVSMLLPIGDTLLATPAVTVLRKRFPWAKITVLASRGNAGILRDNPNIDHLILTDDPTDGAESKVLRLARGLSELRQTKYDLVINLSPVGGLVLMMAGVYQKPLTVEKPVLWWLIGGHSDHYRARHAVDHYLQAVAPVLERPLTEEERQPRLDVTAKDRAAARRLLRERGLSPAHLLVTMHVGGDGFNGRKRWAPKRFAEVAARLIERFDETARRLRGRGLALERRERARLLRRCDGAPLIVADACEHIAHAAGPLVMATSFSRTRRALPSSIASAA